MHVVDQSSVTQLNEIPEFARVLSCLGSVAEEGWPGLGSWVDEVSGLLCSRPCEHALHGFEW
jgi:hypothetical protein